MLRMLITNTRVMLTLLVILMIFGAFSYAKIAKEDSPDVPIPVMYVSMNLPGISPEDAVNLLIKPMEEELRSLKGLDEMEATAYEGGGNVVVKFTAGFSPQNALNDVRAKVDMAKSKLPAEADEPVVTEVNISLFPILTVVLNGELPERAIRRLAEDLQDKLEGIPGVLEAQVNGVRDEMLLVEVKRDKLESYGIPLATLLGVVTGNNRLIPSGSLDVGSAKYAIKIPSLFKTPDDVLALPLLSDGDRVVRVRDVADVRAAFKDPTTIARVDGRPAVTIQVKKRIGANILQVVDAAKATVAEQAKQWPAHMGYRFLGDKSQDIRIQLNDLQNSVVISLVLVLITVLLAMDWRGALLVGMTVPGSFFAAILLLFMLGYTTNIVVLFALILSVGILVDGAIVVAEYAQQLRRQGKAMLDAYIGAAEAMAWPVGAGTLIILIVFLPLLWWPDVVGEFMKYMPITLGFTLLASWLMAMVFLPALGRILPEPAADYHHGLGDRMFDWLGERYRHMVAVVLRRPATWVLATAIFLVLVMAVYARLGKGVEFFPNIEPDRANLEVKATGDLSIASQDMIVREVERRLGKLDGVATQSVLVGKGERDQAENVIGTIGLEYDRWTPERPTNAAILEQALTRIGTLPGVTVATAAERAGPQQGKPVQITLLGQDFATLRAAGEALTARMRATPGLTNVDNNLPQPGIEWSVFVDRAEAGRAGTDLGNVGQMISLATQGAIIGKWRPGDRKEELDIVARFAESERTLSTLDELRVAGSRGNVAIRDLTTTQATPKVTQIQRLDQKTQVTVGADVAPGFLADDMVKAVQAELARTSLPAGLEVRFRGDTKAQDSSATFLQMAFLVGLAMIAMILLIEFNSFAQVLILLSAVVLSTIGVLLGHLIMGKPFGIVMSGLGIIALAGLVVLHNLVLIDTYNHLRAKGMVWYDALLETSQQRLRPVLLTSVTTIIGLLPLAFKLNFDIVNREITYNAPSTQWWDQLASSIVYGLTFATILTLIVTPCMIALVEEFHDWRQARRTRRAMPTKQAASARR